MIWSFGVCLFLVGLGYLVWVFGRLVCRLVEGVGFMCFIWVVLLFQGLRCVLGWVVYVCVYGGCGVVCVCELGVGGGWGCMCIGVLRLEVCLVQESGVVGLVCFLLVGVVSISVFVSFYFGCGKQSVCREWNVWFCGGELQIEGVWFVGVWWWWCGIVGVGFGVFCGFLGLLLLVVWGFV